uniref:Hexosyltransferase n=1 Tax=Rhabditophanes sp. KR3021 TaxID=114890 RepID=A0AC35U4R7_9BILA
MQIYYLSSLSCDTIIKEHLASSNINQTIPYRSKHSFNTTVPKFKTFLIVMIMSSPNDVEKRNVIRNTWIKLTSRSQSTVSYRFPVGVKKMQSSAREKLRDEHNVYNDLVFLHDVEEDYQLLTIKTAQTMKYADSHFDFKFLLKVDSDSFVRIGLLLKSLKDIDHPKLYWGFLDGRAKPFKKGKWKENDWVLCDRYLPYQLGGGYVLSKVLVSYIATNLPLLKMYKSEDVAVGAWLAGLDVKYVHDPRFDTEFASRGCNNEYLITHKQNESMMGVLYKNIVKTGKLCSKEFRKRPSYIYDFSVDPSLCCVRKNESRIP